MKAEWRDYDWSKSAYPERCGDYELYRQLVTSAGDVVATIECFVQNPIVFYSNAFNGESWQRGGPKMSFDVAIQWCEHTTRNKVN